MTGSGLPHEPPSFINPRIPLDAHGIANHPTQHAFLAGSVKALDATPSLGGDNIPRAIRKNGELKRRASRKPEHPRFKTDDAFKREQEEREEAKRRARDREAVKRKASTSRRRRQVGFAAVASAAFGVLFNAFVSSKKKKKTKRE
jgi:hypothetical protein